MISRAGIDREIAEYGKESMLYRIRVLGLPPDGGTDTVIPRKFIDAARAVCGKIDGEVQKFQPCAGIDVSGEGEDRDVVAVVRNHHLSIEHYGAGDPTDSGFVSTCAEIFQEKNIRLAYIDAGGVGQYLCPSLENRGFSQRVYRFHFGSPSFSEEIRAKQQKVLRERKQKVLSQSPSSGEQYENKITEAYFLMRTALRYASEHPFSGITLEDREDLLDQLASRRFEISPRTKKIRLEPKEKMRSRGEKSPDLADAAVLALAAYTRRNALRWDGEEKKKDTLPRHGTVETIRMDKVF